MKKKLLLILYLAIFTAVKAQNSFNFNCTRDTVLKCGTACFTLKATIPNISSTTEDYIVNPLSKIPGGCYKPYVAAGAAGNPVEIKSDDAYSKAIDINFSFPFYGKIFQKLVASTNGYISFDIDNANHFSEFEINKGTDLPQLLFDRALIMGPYHDIDPSLVNSPTKQIKFDVIGVAPHRKWIISYFKIPLFSCSNKIQNTHQIVLYESLGLIEVFVSEKEICPTWNDGGRAIIGIQNFDQNKAVMAPGRKASSPPWGAIGMNESWRFVPIGGPTLFKKVELLDLANNLISVGNVNDIGNGTFDVTFPNVCQPPNINTAYIVKSTYKKFDDPNVEVFGMDTVNISFNNLKISTDVVNLTCFGKNNGSITVHTIDGIPPFSFSIDGGNSFQDENVFNGLGAGIYNVRVKNNTGCIKDTVITLTQPPLLTSIVNSTDATCKGNDGTIKLLTGGGTPPYEFSIDGGNNFQNNNTFDVPPGNYNNIVIKDAKGCTINTNTLIGLNDTMHLEIGPDTTICEGTSILLQPITNTTTSVFEWTPATALSNPAVKNPQALPTDTIKYTLTAKWGICERIDDITINILHKPQVNAGNDTAVCFNTPAILNGTVKNLSGEISLAWTPGNTINNPGSLKAIAQPHSTQLYTLTAKDNYGCNFTISDNVLITMMPLVKAFAGNDTTAIAGMPHQLSGSGGLNYIWSPGNVLNNPFSPNPFAKLLNDTKFTVWVSDAIGCKDTDDIFIKVYKGPAYYIPNAFTPNGDGLNDIFRPIPVGIQSTTYFRIFDRYGQVVFETTQFLKGWDGTYKGKKQPPGTYVWMIKGVDKDGKIIEMKNTVILVQ